MNWLSSAEACRYDVDCPGGNVCVDGQCQTEKSGGDAGGADASGDGDGAAGDGGGDGQTGPALRNPVFLDTVSDGFSQATSVRGRPGTAMRAWGRGGFGFADLPPDTQEEIVIQASQARRGTLPRVFFEANREYGFRAYYADPASWPSLGYRGPPQPDGFMDHAEAPQ